VSKKCDSAVVYFSDSELQAMARNTETAIAARQFGYYADFGIPRGLRVTCPDCGRPNVLVKPFCGGGSSGDNEHCWYYRLRSHERLSERESAAAK
jgi:hypothetical protein